MKIIGQTQNGWIDIDKPTISHDENGNALLKPFLNTTCIVQDDEVLIVRYTVEDDNVYIRSIKTPDGDNVIFAKVGVLANHIRHERNLYR